MKIRYIVYTVLLVGVVSLVAYRISKNKNSNKNGKGGKAAGAPAVLRVDAVVVKPTDFANSLAVAGSIDANEAVQIHAEVSGLIRGIYFKEGSNVKKGQPLIKIDDAELRAQLAQAITKQNLASESEHRAKLLLQKEAISQEEYDTALANLKSLQAQTQLVRAQLDKTTVAAPFSGKIGLRSVSVGDYITPATEIANLLSINPVKITFSIPEKYSLNIKKNTDISFTIAGSDKKFKAQVYAVEPGIDPATRTLQIRAKAENPSGDLIPGSFAQIQFPLATIENAILIPTEAVIPVQNGKKVFVSQNGKAKEVMIETSTRTDSDILVTSGLKPGDTVLTTGVMSLKNETPVKVQVQND